MLTKEERDRLRGFCGEETFVVAECWDGACDEEEIWTVSHNPEEAGWVTDSGYNGYGLSKVEATAYAEARNSLAFLLDDLDAKDAEIARLREALTLGPELVKTALQAGFGCHSYDSPKAAERREEILAKMDAALTPPKEGETL